MSSWSRGEPDGDRDRANAPASTRPTTRRSEMQTEEMRSSLLSAVSHDLKTPLASITGAASTLRSQGDKLSAETRHDLLDSIADEADRLGRLVSNLLDITRLESGVELRRDCYPLEEIVGSALQRMERQLRERTSRPRRHARDPSAVYMPTTC